MKLHLTENRPLIYFSGGPASSAKEEDIIKQGAKYRCFSYAYTCKDGFYYQKPTARALSISVENDLGVMMDSGAASFHNLQKKGLRKLGGKYSVRHEGELKDLVINSYVKYVKKERKNWDFYLTFDYLKQCPIIYDVTKELEKKGIRPVPVYHGDQSTEWLTRYCSEGHKLICLGSVKRNAKTYRLYFDKCFNIAAKHGVVLHGLAITSLSLMFGFPWYSVDSATWAKVAAYGCILCTSDTVNDTFGYIHMTDRRHGQSRGVEYLDLSKTQKKSIEREVNDCGFDIHDLCTDSGVRSLYNVYVFANKIDHLKAAIAGAKTTWKSLL